MNQPLASAGPAPSASAYALLLVAPMLFASNMLVARWLDGGIPPVGLTIWRWSLTLLLLLPFCGGRLWAARRRLWRDWPVLLLLGALGMGICGAPVYIAGRTTTATNMGLIYTATPVLIVVFARLFWGEPVTWRQAIGIALCMAGVVIVVVRGELAVLAELAFAPGDLWIVLAAIGWAFYSVLLQHRNDGLDLLVRFAAIVVGGVVANVPFYVLEMAQGQHIAFDGRTLAILLFVALVPGLGAFLSYGRLVATIGPGRTGLLMYMIPLYNAGLAWLLLGEGLAAHHVIGAALTLPGIYLATRTSPLAPSSGST